MIHYFGECFAPRFRRFAIKPLYGVLAKGFNRFRMGERQ